LHENQFQRINQKRMTSFLGQKSLQGGQKGGGKGQRSERPKGVQKESAILSEMVKRGGKRGALSSVEGPETGRPKEKELQKYTGNGKGNVYAGNEKGPLKCGRA